MDDKNVVIHEEKDKQKFETLSKTNKSLKIPVSAVTDREWDEETDKKLLSLVKLYGSKRWKQIGRLMKRKTATCIRRFSCYLKPGN